MRKRIGNESEAVAPGSTDIQAACVTPSNPEIDVARSKRGFARRRSTAWSSRGSRTKGTRAGTAGRSLLF